MQVDLAPLSATVYRSRGRIPGSRHAPAIPLQAPAPTADAQGRMHVQADVAGSSFYEVTFERSIDGGDWTAIGTDDSSPAYTVFDELPGDLAEARRSPTGRSWTTATRPS